jgi:hypothetical protein
MFLDQTESNSTDAFCLRNIVNFVPYELLTDGLIAQICYQNGQ